MGTQEERNEDYRRDAIDARRRTRCECGDDLPGRCPGPENCPYASHEDEEDE